MKPRRVAIMSLSFLLLVLATAALVRSASDILVAQVKQRIEVWSARPDLIVVSDIDETDRTLTLARKLDAHNPDLVELAGGVEEFRALRADSNLAYDHYRKALAYYEQAAAMRPNWAYVRSNIVRVNLVTGHYGKELEVAMQNYMRVGAWERATQLSLLPPLYNARDKLSVPVIQSFHALLQRSAAYDGLATLKFISDDRQLRQLADLWFVDRNIDEAFVGIGLAGWMRLTAEQRDRVTERLLELYERNAESAVHLAQTNRRMIVLCMIVPKDKHYPRQCSGRSIL